MSDRILIGAAIVLLVALTIILVFLAFSELLAVAASFERIARCIVRIPCT